VSDLDIDAAILAVTKASWRKVALIVSQAAKHVGGDFAAREDAYYFVASRIQALVADGRLASQGDLSEWRHSEIRLA
jgi:uncharacterized protein DUF3658